MITGSAAALSSCSQLDALPTQARTEGNVILDQKSAEVALNGVYNRFVGQTTSRSFITHFWTTLHEIWPAQLSGYLQYAFGRTQIENDALLPPTGTSFFWTPNYSILNAANVVITEVDGLEDSRFTGSRKKEILAEARFLRAYAHANLLSYFAEWFKIGSPLGVLLRKEPLKLSNAAQKRSTVKESYDFIMEDLDYAIANAADIRPNYYANKTAAKALKLRMLMMRGQGTDYTDAITLADDIMNDGYELEGNLRDLFQLKGLTSKEVILGITPYPNQTGRLQNYEYIQSGAYFATSQFRDLLANDPRSTWMYRTVGTSNPTTTPYKDSIYLSKYYGPKVEEAYAFRLTEVYLLKAEAIVRSGGSINDARALLRTVMEKAGVTDFTAIDNATTPEQMLVELYKETARNMTAEDGIEWRSLLRLPFATIQQFRPAITEQRQYILPIPAEEFQLNPAIGDQNTGYPKQ